MTFEPGLQEYKDDLDIKEITVGRFMQIIEEIDNDDSAFKIHVSRFGNVSEDTYGMSILI